MSGTARDDRVSNGGLLLAAGSEKLGWAGLCNLLISPRHEKC